jgi:hypothetical protein
MNNQANMNQMSPAPSSMEVYSVLKFIVKGREVKKLVKNIFEYFL